MLKRPRKRLIWEGCGYTSLPNTHTHENPVVGIRPTIRPGNQADQQLHPIAHPFTEQAQIDTEACLRSESAL